MNQDQWKGRIEVVIGTAMELTGVVLHSAELRQRGVRERTVGRARARYGGAVAAVTRRSQ